MPSSQPSILLAGCGKLGSALLKGWLKRHTPPTLVVIDRHMESPDTAVTVVRKAEDIAADFKPDIVILAVKPDRADDIITAIGATLGSCLGKAAFLSVMAGRTCESLGQVIKTTGNTCPVLRAMPNTPSTVGAGISGLYAGPGASEAHQKLCHDLLSAVGDVVTVSEEKDLSTVTALSGSGPAYVFLLAELLENAGRAHGLSADTARTLVRGMIYGAGCMLQEQPEDAADLREAVTSPKGTTAAALSKLMAKEAWPTAIDQAVAAAVHRADELSV